MKMTEYFTFYEVHSSWNMGWTPSYCVNLNDVVWC